MNIIVVATLKVKKEFKDEIYNTLVELYTQTHKNDNGCIQYELHQDLEDENSFTFIETWENMSLLEEHSNKQHFLDFVEKIDGKLENMDIKKLKKIIL